MAKFGRELIFLHTYGERMKPSPNAQIPHGKARCTKPVEEKPNQYQYDATTLTIGEGEFSPVPKEIWELEASGFKPVQHWVKTRLYKGTGRQNLPLDKIRPKWSSETSDELLALIWLLEATFNKLPAINECFTQILESDLFTETELTTPA